VSPLMGAKSPASPTLKPFAGRGEGGTERGGEGGTVRSPSHHPTRDSHGLSQRGSHSERGVRARVSLLSPEGLSPRPSTTLLLSSHATGGKQPSPPPPPEAGGSTKHRRLHTQARNPLEVAHDTAYVTNGMPVHTFRLEHGGGRMIRAPQLTAKAPPASVRLAPTATSMLDDPSSTGQIGSPPAGTGAGRAHLAARSLRGGGGGGSRGGGGGGGETTREERLITVRPEPSLDSLSPSRLRPSLTSRQALMQGLGGALTARGPRGEEDGRPQRTGGDIGSPISWWKAKHSDQAVTAAALSSASNGMDALIHVSSALGEPHQARRGSKDGGAARV